LTRGRPAPVCNAVLFIVRTEERAQSIVHQICIAYGACISDVEPVLEIIVLPAFQASTESWCGIGLPSKVAANTTTPTAPRSTKRLTATTNLRVAPPCKAGRIRTLNLMKLVSRSFFREVLISELRYDFVELVRGNFLPRQQQVSILGYLPPHVEIGTRVGARGTGAAKIGHSIFPADDVNRPQPSRTSKNI
jgi:hypothetical protein